MIMGYDLLIMYAKSFTSRQESSDRLIPEAEEVLATQFLYKLTLTLFHTKSIAVQPSVMGYIAKSVSLVGQRKKLAVLHRVCDIAFKYVHSTHIFSFLLIKVSRIPCTGTWSPLSCTGCHRMYGRRS